MSFRDRTDAGRALAERLVHLAGESPIVLALPRGGVPVAAEIARALAAPLDLVMVRKIGAPHHAELGIGAVVDGVHPEVVLNEEIVAELDVSPAYIAEEVQRQLHEIERRRRRYLGGRAASNLTGRTVIVVDDGIATGGTIRGVVQALTRALPARLVLAVPVAPAETIERLRQDADEVVCLATPEPFYAVGQHYDDFRQVSDDEVTTLLHEARSPSEELAGTGGSS